MSLPYKINGRNQLESVSFNHAFEYYSKVYDLPKSETNSFDKTLHVYPLTIVDGIGFVCEYYHFTILDFMLICLIEQHFECMSIFVNLMICSAYVMPLHHLFVKLCCIQFNSDPEKSSKTIEVLYNK